MLVAVDVSTFTTALSLLDSKRTVFAFCVETEAAFACVFKLFVSAGVVNVDVAGTVDTVGAR